jgi:DNA mismatch repair protein MSH3
MSPHRDKQVTPGGTKRKHQPTLISNYFKRVDTPNEKGKSSPLPGNRDHQRSSSSSPVPPPSSSDIEDGDDRVSKKPRLDPHGTSQTSGEKNALRALMSPKIKEFRPAPESPRTARYKFIPSSPNKEDEIFSPEELAKRKSLHERFVAKLGRPDSMATLRRASAAGMQTEEEGEDVDADGEEDEGVTEVTKSLRDKYAVSEPKQTEKSVEPSISATKAKLTPLERQYVEIKNKHPDTILMIEVGYKFRFFGEDAKVCLVRNSFDIRLPQRN